MSAPAYAELQVCTNFSFLRGASHAEELVQQAVAHGLAAIAVTDRNTLAGAVRMLRAAGESKLRFVLGVRLDFTDAPSVLCYPADRAAYGRLCRLLTLGRRRAPKGECWLRLADLLDYGEGQLLAALPPEEPLDAEAAAAFESHLAVLAAAFGDHLYLAVQQLYRGDDARRLHGLGDIADRLGLPLVATNDVHYHHPDRRRLQDVLSCIREGCTLHEAGRRLLANAERHLKPPQEMARLFAHRPEAVANTLALVERCQFQLTDLRYEYPEEIVPEGRTPQEHLEGLVRLGAAKCYPDGVPAKVTATLDRELQLIAERHYAPYFLTVHDIVRYAREEGILCQGRGSAANSVVCFVLGITAVDPTQVELLFERFLSPERNEPPDIDVDFEHERREEVIQYIYRKYTRDRAGLAATVISYRPRSAIRDVGKALGLSPDVVGALAGLVWGQTEEIFDEQRVQAAGLDPADATLWNAVTLAQELIGFPRHLSQHVGGFVIARGRLDELVPIENAAMEKRTVIEWDKDDLETLGLMKVDVLALGMLTCIHKAFDLLEAEEGRRTAMTDLKPTDGRVYDMLCKADSIGVFQVESRAQMTMLPRLQPRCYYDLVIEVAIVRPGPIQGDMVHPYLKRRDDEKAGREIPYPSEELREVLKSTLGIPLFQEQAMKIAMVAAGFTAAEADDLRRAMATFRHTGDIPRFEAKFIAGMTHNKYERDFAVRCFNQIKGFGDYGFPESHAASFAHLVYVSAWLKCHHPAIFCAAILNSQPMGFYAPAQLVRDAREHGVEVRHVDVNFSAWDCTIEHSGGRACVRLGFRQVKGFRADYAKELVKQRPATGYRSVRDAWQRAEVPVAALERLAEADGWQSLNLDRRAALWQVRALGEAPLPLFAASEARVLPGDNRPPIEAGDEPAVRLPEASLGEQVIEDYRSLYLSLKAHPLALLRARLAARGILPAATLGEARDGSPVEIAGLVLIRQRPGTASGIVFATLEDETGIANIVIWPALFERFRRPILGARLLAVRGRLQREGLVTHVVGGHFTDLSAWLGDLLEREAGHHEEEVAFAIPEGRNFR